MTQKIVNKIKADANYLNRLNSHCNMKKYKDNQLMYRFVDKVLNFCIPIFIVKKLKEFAEHYIEHKNLC